MVEMWDCFEAIAQADVTLSQMRVLLAIARKSWGWRRRSERIGSTELARMTGLDPSDARKALRSLEALGMITRSGGCNGRRALLTIVPDPAQWRVEMRETRGPSTPGIQYPGAECSRGPSAPQPGGSQPPNPGALTPPSTRTTNENYQRERADPSLDLGMITPESGVPRCESAEAPQDGAPPRAMHRADERERAARMRIMAEVLRCHGQRPASDQVLARARATRHVPLELLQAASERAAATNQNPRGFAPPAAAIVQAALEISKSWGLHDAQTGRPDWYLRSIGERPRASAPHRQQRAAAGGAA